MNCKTHELYDENEYFLKYLSIHPILIYSNKKHDKQKKQFQEYLLDQFNKELINYNELEYKYNIIVKIENDNNILLENIKEEQLKLNKLIKKHNTEYLSNIYEILNKKIE